MSNELSAKELYALHQNPVKPFHFPGEKILIPEGTEEEKNVVETSLSAIKTYLNGTRVERRNSRSLGLWLPESRIVKITRHIGNIYPQFGYMSNSEIYLSPEEALFSLETNKLNILWNDVPFSVQQAYIVLLNTRKELDKYKSFQKLSLLGYRIPNKEFVNKQKSDECTSPKKMKLDDECTKLVNSTKNNEIRKDDDNVAKFFEDMKANGPSTVKYCKNENEDFRVYMSSVDVKNNEPSYQVLIRPDSGNIKFEDASTESDPRLISFSGVESVSFYELEAVELDNT